LNCNCFNLGKRLFSGRATQTGLGEQLVNDLLTGADESFLEFLRYTVCFVTLFRRLRKSAFQNFFYNVRILN